MCISELLTNYSSSYDLTLQASDQSPCRREGGREAGREGGRERKYADREEGGSKGVDGMEGMKNGRMVKEGVGKIPVREYEWERERERETLVVFARHLGFW